MLIRYRAVTSPLNSNFISHQSFPSASATASSSSRAGGIAANPKRLAKYLGTVAVLSVAVNIPRWGGYSRPRGRNDAFGLEVKKVEQLGQLRQQQLGQ